MHQAHVAKACGVCFGSVSELLRPKKLPGRGLRLHDTGRVTLGVSGEKKKKNMFVTQV